MEARYTIRKHQLLDDVGYADFEQVIPRLYTFMEPLSKSSGSGRRTPC